MMVMIITGTIAIVNLKAVITTSIVIVILNNILMIHSANDNNDLITILIDIRCTRMTVQSSDYP